MTYEDLLLQRNDLFFKEMSLYEVDGLKGLYVDGCIAIEKSLSNTEKGCICAEEIGHHETSVGDTLNQCDDTNRKQELKARMWAYDKKIGLVGIINAFNANCLNSYEMAEFLDCTEDFLQDALLCYKNKYGNEIIKVDNYAIYFEPFIGVYKMF